MNVSWTSILVIDVFGSILTLGLSICCAIFAWEWISQKRDDVFRQYIFLLTLAIVCFAISRSFGHLIKQVLLFQGMGQVWKQIAPFSGSINSATFIVIFAFGLYFHRFQKIHHTIEKYQNNLEEMITKRTAELEETNVALQEEIVERKHFELALKESQGYLQAILDHTTLPIFLKDIEGKYILINKEFERIAQISNKEIIGKSDFEVFPESIATLFREHDERVKREDSPLEFDEKIPLADGEHTFLNSIFPLRDEGVVYAVGGVCTDITRRKKAEESLAAEQERLAVTLRSIGDGVITTDTAGMVVLINKRAEELTGWSQQEALGQPLKKVFCLLRKNRDPYEDPTETVLRTGQIETLEEHTILLPKNGKEKFIADSCAPIRDKESKIIGVVLVFRDVTQQLKMEKEISKVKKLESVGILAGGIAHDFNNILTAILGNINLAQRDTSMQIQTQQMLAEATKASLRAKDLTQQLLTFSKGGDPVKETALLQEVIRDSANFVLHGKTVACDFHFSDDLWLVDIDKSQISQVIQNIIINANQAMPEGGRITVSCENVSSHLVPHLPPDKNYVKILISDQGIGIPPNVIETIFDPYFSTKNQGSGLGLAICHSIIKKHGGNISVESTPGKGATFTLFLPASVHNELETTREERRSEKILKAKIMVMDDEEMVRNVARAMLTQLGHDVVLAHDGDEAIHLFRESMELKEPIDLIIMDLTIPGAMGGKDAVKGILDINPSAKVLVSSGYSNDPIMANFKNYGFCAALVKPFHLQDLSKVICHVLS